jgi:GDP-4-dehydro-6-deoxy-D-mannose reductase
MKKENKKKKALITGIAGFVGSHMAELLLKEGFDVFGIARWRSSRECIADVEDKVSL